MEQTGTGAWPAPAAAQRLLPASETRQSFIYQPSIDLRLLWVNPRLKHGGLKLPPWNIMQIEPEAVGRSELVCFVAAVVLSPST